VALVGDVIILPPLIHSLYNATDAANLISTMEDWEDKAKSSTLSWYCFLSANPIPCSLGSFIVFPPRQPYS